MTFKNASLLIIIGIAVFGFWNKLTITIKSRQAQKLKEAFWEREAQANFVRKKPIDHLDYLTIPDELYFDLLPDNIEVPSIRDTINGLRESKILNLTGYSNTDLKIMYGTANITPLSLYDQNYTTLITTLQKWADILYDSAYEKEAVEIMEYLIRSNADIGRTYRMLGKYYKDNSMDDKFEELLKSAENIKSINGSHILDSLKEL